MQASSEGVAFVQSQDCQSPWKRIGPVCHMEKNTRYKRGLDINNLWCGHYALRTYRVYSWYFRFHTWVHMSNPPSSMETYLSIHKGRANSHIPPHLSH